MRVKENGLSLSACARLCVVATLAVLAVFALAGCVGASSAANTSGSANVSDIASTNAATGDANANTAASSRVISAAEGRDLMASSGDYLLIDVREQYEYAQGHIEKAICIPYTALETNRDKLPADTQSTIIVYCRSGNRSATAAKTLVNMGYMNVLDMGGIIDWPYEVVVGDAKQEPSAEVAAQVGSGAQTESGAQAGGGEQAENGVQAGGGAQADHEHQFEPYDCNYQKCTVCGHLERY